MEQPQEQPVTPDQAAYNVITDTVAGPNLRWRDNLLQGLAVLICAGIGAIVLGLYFKTGIAIVGGIVGGMIVGIFTSGIVLMLYRGIRHLSGRHD